MMSETRPPLTPSELADLKAKAKAAKHANAEFMVTDILRLVAMVERLQSADMKREIENAAYERAANQCSAGLVGKWCASQIRSLTQPPAQKEDGE